PQNGAHHGQLFLQISMPDRPQGGQMNPQLQIVAPEKCVNCDFVPVKRNNQDQVVKVEHQWIGVAINPAVHFFICPECLMIMPNANVVQNLQIMRAANESRIVTPHMAMVPGKLT
ncbi:MAG: hypothetical protein KJ556_20815, partial [Gammaproteobacteria bacterium]|nr:hypothetical protein [Gammaproteobacteria bacterium]